MDLLCRHAWAWHLRWLLWRSIGNLQVARGGAGHLLLCGKHHSLLASPSFLCAQGGLGLALALAFLALNIATGNRRVAALAIFCVIGTFSSAAGIGGAMMYWHLEVAEVVPCC